MQKIFLKIKQQNFQNEIIQEHIFVVSSYKQENVIVGYFAIANKSTIIKKSILSKSKRKRFLTFANYDNDINGYHIALPLIGQIGKNYYNGYDKIITGDILLKLACNKIKEIQNAIGGRFVYLECEDKLKLKEFYESNGFVCFGKRNLEKDERDKNNGNYLLQMLKDLSKEENQQQFFLLKKCQTGVILVQLFNIRLPKNQIALYD